MASKLHAGLPLRIQPTQDFAMEGGCSHVLCIRELHEIHTLLQQLAVLDYMKLALLVSLTDIPSTTLNTKDCRRSRHYRVVRAFVVQSMCKKGNGHGPSSLATRKRQTTPAIMRWEDSIVEYGTECSGIVLIGLFCTEDQKFLPVACSM